MAATPGREAMGSTIERGIVSRVAAGLKYAITGVGPENFFGPSQPLAPAAQDKTEGRQFDYPVAVNLRINPRSDEAIGFSALRAMADGYDLMRLVIETRKDQIEAFEWEIVPKDNTKTADQFKDDIAAATVLLERPDQEHDWSEWLRALIEDLLVIDAVCVYPRMNRGGKLYGLELVDGATVKRLIDDGGRTPLPPSPAYQQILKGITAADYTTEQLVYMARNFRTSKIYGYSPVEQVIMTVNIALRRQISQLEYYTSGNIPEAIAQLPKDWTPNAVKEFQAWWDSLMEGNTAQRRMMKFIPNLDGIVFPKVGVLKDEYDEWLARIICFAFSISPTPFVKQNNRATSEQSAETAKEEGLMPLLRWLQGKMTFLLNTRAGFPQLAFRWKIQSKVDPLTQAQVDNLYTAMRVIAPDEVRENLGMDAMTPEQREAAWPTPPEPVAPAPVEQNGNDPAPTDAKGIKGNEPPVEKIVVNVAPPVIYLGDTLVRVAGAEPSPVTVHVEPPPPAQVTVHTPENHFTAPDVNVTLGDVTVQADMRAVPGQKAGERMVRAERQPDGSLLAKIVTTEDGT